MLSVDNAASFLLECGLIDNTWIIDGDLTVRSVVRRNRNLKVEGPAGTGFLIKQSDDLTEAGRDTLRCEASFHRFCREEPAVAEMVRSIPRLLFDDAEEAVLVFELVPDAVSLWSRSEVEDSLALAALGARSLGWTLGTLHRVFSPSAWVQDPRLAWLVRALPWVLMIHRPGPAMLADLSAANFQMVRVLQTQDGVSEHLDHLCRQWRPTAVIHGDIKFDNVLIRPSRVGHEPAPVELWIADWETVRFGDPAWDLAGALQDFLVLWVSSMPLSVDLTVEEMIAQARVPLGKLRSAMRALWSGYREGAGLGPAEADGFLLRSVAFSAVRLIQSAFELSHAADRLAGSSVILLQISANLMEEPELGQIQLYGIPLGCPLP